MEAINLSRSFEQGKQMDVKKMPTIRLYKKDGSTAQFDKAGYPHRTVETLEDFLAKNGIKK